MIARRFAAAVAGAAVAAMLMLQPHPGVAAESIGVAAAAQNEVTGIQGGATRTLAAGSQVFQEEMIRTGARSMAQLLFLDETSLSIGPLSEVTLDRFVFNPATGAGDVVLSTARGAFRFITGSQSPSNYQLRTPFASIGVRGTIVDCYATDAGIYCTAQEGTVVLVVNGVEYTLGPGEALYVSADGEITGPFTPDGEFFAVAGIAPWPLYGAFLPGEHEQFDVPDGSTVLLDELFEQTPPDDCEGGCCYEYEYECDYD
jgi:ferric-dicitrate binding protein FerR (iron transport regulator)